MALQLGLLAEGVTSLRLGRMLNMSKATAANKLAGYETSGYLEIVGGSGGAGSPYVYRTTRSGRELLAGRQPGEGVWEFAELIDCWGLFW